MFSLMFFHVVFPGKRLVTTGTGESLLFCFFTDFTLNFEKAWRFFDFDFEAGLFLSHFTTVFELFGGFNGRMEQKINGRSLSRSQ